MKNKQNIDRSVSANGNSSEEFFGNEKASEKFSGKGKNSEELSENGKASENFTRKGAQQAAAKRSGKKKIFDAGLYLEAILQLRPFAVISVILLLGNVLVSLAAEMINYLDAREYAAANTAAGAAVVVDYTGTADYYQFQLMAFAFMLVIVPIMTLYLFSFLNKRNLSDFYHSIPHTRLCLSASFLLAIVTYIVAIVGICGALGAAGYLALPFDVEFYDVGVAVPVFNVICGSIFMMAVFWLAMSLTGTIFTNIAAAVLIFAIPTCVLFYTGAVICEFVPYIPYEGLPAIFNGSCNVITGMFSYLVFWATGADYDNIFGVASTGVCTLLTALVLIALGCVFFRFRKSEFAESASIHPAVQSVFRIGAGFLVSMFVTGSILIGVMDDSDMEAEYIFWWIVFYAIAIFVYYLFELVTTRQPRRLLHIWKGLLVVVLANVIWAGAEYAISTYEMNWCPDENAIISVELSDQDGYYMSDWWQAKISNVTLQSEDMTRLVAEALDNTIDLWKEYQEDPDKYWSLYDDETVIPTDIYYYNMSATVTFKIHTKTGTTARSVKMTADQYSRFVSYLAGEEAGFAESYTEMPDFSKIEDMTCSLFSSDYYEREVLAEEDVSRLTREQWKEIYETWCAEAKTADFTSLFYLTYEEGGYESDYLSVTIVDNSRYYYACLPLTPDFPETLSLIASYNAEEYAELMEQGVVSDENILRELTDNGSGIYYSYMYLITPDDTEISGYSSSYCWKMIDDWLSYYLEDFYADYYGSSASDDPGATESDAATADSDAQEGTTTAESDAQEGTATTESDAQEVTTVTGYTYQEILEVWEEMADELDRCMELEITGGESILIVYLDADYYNEEGEYEYRSFAFVTAVTDDFVELYEEYVRMTNDEDTYSIVYY